MKCFRFEVKTSLFGKFHGPLKGTDFHLTGLTEERYRELLDGFNPNLYVPYGQEMGVFWFTQKGLEAFGPSMVEFIKALMTEGNRIVRSARIIEAEISETDENITFFDNYFQLASTGKYAVKVVKNI